MIWRINEIHYDHDNKEEAKDPVDLEQFELQVVEDPHKYGQNGLNS